MNNNHILKTHIYIFQAVRIFLMRRSSSSRKRRRDDYDYIYSGASDDELLEDLRNSKEVVNLNEGITTRSSTKNNTSVYKSKSLQDFSSSKTYKSSLKKKKSDNGVRKIDHIFMSRKTQGGIEYLIMFQKQEEQFAQWVPESILMDLPNAQRQIDKFNDTNMQMSIYDTSTHVYGTSYNSPLHVISRRPISTQNGLYEYLYQLNVETGVAFYWEPYSAESPQNLIDHYLTNRACVENTYPMKPEKLVLTSDMVNDYKSKAGNIPRDYQVEGVNWMLSCFCNNHGFILADEMGLGKTIQTLTFLNFLDKNTDFHGPHLIVVRTNTLNQWCSEIEKWSHLNYLTYTGQPETRNILQQYQVPYIDDDGNKVANKYSFNILLVTYDMFLKDSDFMSSIDWQNVIVDEGHRIKNKEGKKHNALYNIRTLSRIILTGTPIQNNMFELWTLLTFVAPEYFPKSDVFTDDDVESIDKDTIYQMKEMIAPHIMKRSLIDVEKSLVPKDERVAFLHVTKPQRMLIRLAKMHELSRLKKSQDLDSTQEANMMQRICNHPFLVDGAHDYFQRMYPEMSRLELMINCSAKFIFLDRILPTFKGMGRSVLIFSQKVKILRLLDEYCKLKGYTNELLVGNLTDQEKKQAIAQFCDTDKDVFIFLISTRSGAEGLNLTKASITIIFDPDWNPQNDIQALGRCHRIGQTQKVDVIRLLTYGTYEHDMYARSQRKLKLWTTLLGDGSNVSKPKKAKLPPKVVEVDKVYQDETLLHPKPFQSVHSFDGMTRVSELKMYDDDEPEVAPQLIPEPPDLSLPFTIIENESFESIMDRSSSITHDIQMSGTTRKNFPNLDLSMGLDDEQFLELFPLSSDSNTVTKKTKQKISVRVQIDPKQAKKIIKYIEYYGYGHWDEIYAGCSEICPREQLEKFCSATTMIHFRACDLSFVNNYPLLIRRLAPDVPNFNTDFCYCTDTTNWFNIFGKRSGLAGEATVCRQIANYIIKTAPSFLSRLEVRLAVDCFIKIGKDFDYSRLKPFKDYTTEYDRMLLNNIINKEQIEPKDFERCEHIMKEIKSHLLIHENAPSERLEYWSMFEINTVMNGLKNYGVDLLDASYERDGILIKLGLLSKTHEDAFEFIRIILTELSGRKMGDLSQFEISPTTIKVSGIPEKYRPDVPTILPGIVVDTVHTNLFIFNFLKNTSNSIDSRTLEDPVEQGSWMTYSQMSNLAEELLKFGIESLPSFLLSEKHDCRTKLTSDDIAWLIGDNPEISHTNSNIPRIFSTREAFYEFLKNLSSVHINDDFIDQVFKPVYVVQPKFLSQAPAITPPQPVIEIKQELSSRKKPKNVQKVTPSVKNRRTSRPSTKSVSPADFYDHHSKSTFASAKSYDDIQIAQSYGAVNQQSSAQLHNHMQTPLMFQSQYGSLHVPNQGPMNQYSYQNHVMPPPYAQNNQQHFVQPGYQMNQSSLMQQFNQMTPGQNPTFSQQIPMQNGYLKDFQQFRSMNQYQQN